MSTAPTPTYRLFRTPERPASKTAVELDAEQQRVAAHSAGPLLVLAGPGTGKTTTLVEAVHARISEGADAARILLLTFSRRAARELAERVGARLGGATIEPIARTFHSYAFGLLRMVASERSEPQPRLLSGPEQDLIIRELLAGDAAGAGIAWPVGLRAALATRGFATTLRDLLLRAYERGVDPATLARWGREHGRDEWRAAAAFMRQYAEVTQLRNAGLTDGVAYDTAELIRAATRRLREDPQLLAAERARREYVFVDEYQDVDPAQEELLELLCGGGRFLVAVGDPDQSIYAFRGSDPGAIRRFGERFPDRFDQPAAQVALHTSRRGGAALLAASRRVAARLRGPGTHRLLRPIPDAPPGEVEVHVLASPGAEAAYVAHRLREAHLLEGVPWSQMAVIVRSATRQIAALRRALTQAGVPVSVASDEVALAEQPAVAHLLLVLRCALSPAALDEEAALTLLQSPLGGADALDIRRIRQQLHYLAQLAGVARPGAELLVSALTEPAELAAVDEQWVAPARRIAELLATARAAAKQPAATAESVLWAVWEHSGLAEQWQRLSVAGGARGAAADRDLDAVIALFEAAARFTDRLPGAGPAIFVDHVYGQQLPGDNLAPSAQLGEAVRVLTAHGAKGLQWRFVIVAGVQEGGWPDLRVRGSLLGSEEIVDLAAGRPIGPAAAVGRVPQLLDEERRLFYVAVTRASERLIVTAVDSDEDEQPSRFLDEIDPRVVGDGELAPRPITTVPRPLSLAGLVAELRSAVISPRLQSQTQQPDSQLPPQPADDSSASAARRESAAAILARLAAAHAPGAAPSSWWGLASLSDERPLRDPEQPVPVSPSAVEKFDACALRWLLETHGGAGVPTESQSIGVAVHEVAARAGQSASREQLQRELAEQLAEVQLASGWYGIKQRERAERMVNKLADWLAGNDRRYMAAEQEFAVRIGRAALRGRVDRLELDGDGRLVVIDFKTGKSAPVNAEVPRHPQLAMYQLAVVHGGFAEPDNATSSAGAIPAADASESKAPAPNSGHRSGGAALVQLGTGTVKAGEQRQPSLADSDDPGWGEQLAKTVAAGMADSAFAATENGNCRVCPVMSACPLHGPQLTE